MKSVTVYGKPSCQQCRATRKAMSKKSIPFTYLDVTEHPEAASTIRSLGYSSLPVVTVVDGNEVVKHWSGFRPGLIGSLLGIKVVK